MERKNLIILACLVLLSSAILGWGLYSERETDRRYLNAAVKGDLEEGIAFSTDSPLPQKTQAELAAAESKVPQGAKDLSSIPAQRFVDFPNDLPFAVKSGLAKPDVREVRSGCLVDLSSAKVLWAKDARTAYPCASLTKILTTLVALEKVQAADGAVSLRTRVPITASARSTSDSVFLRRYPLSEVPMEELLASAMVKSANDSCTLVAEYLGGGQAAPFIAQMNARAVDLGMASSFFYNPHGLPNEAIPGADNRASAHDLVLASQALLRHPQVRGWTSRQSLQFPAGHPKAVYLNSTNPFVSRRGVYGLKTGFTYAAGWCITLSFDAHSRQHLLVVMGCSSKTRRNNAAAAVLNWAMR